MAKKTSIRGFNTVTSNEIFCKSEFICKRIFIDRLYRLIRKYTNTLPLHQLFSLTRDNVTVQHKNGKHYTITYYPNLSHDDKCEFNMLHGI